MIMQCKYTVILLLPVIVYGIMTREKNLDWFVTNAITAGLTSV